MVKMVFLNEIEIHCLNSVCDDFENANHIQESVVEAIGRRVPDVEIISALRNLANQKLLDVYTFDKYTQKFLKINQWIESRIHQVWFFINSDGRKVLDVNWKGED